MKTNFTIAMLMGAEVTFSDNEGNPIKVELKDNRTGMDDEIYLSHDEKIQLIQWLINSINT